VIAAIDGATVANDQLNRSAEGGSSVAINAFDQRGDVREISGDLSPPDVERVVLYIDCFIYYA
jgi:hypothetical protein